MADVKVISLNIFSEVRKMTYEVTYVDEEGKHEVYVQGEEEVRKVINRPNIEAYGVYMNVTLEFERGDK